MFDLHNSISFFSCSASISHSFYNSIRFALGTVSILFDIVFLLQHYVFYAESDNSGATDGTPESAPDPEVPLPVEAEPLL